MENLNKNQLILLVLLVTFVTSIATGIMTVSLLQQAPVEVTRTINNVVEKTIQQVTPASVSKIIAPQTQNSQTTTVVVGEDDAVISSINRNVKSIVRVEETDVNGYVTFYGLGAVVTADGVIATDRKDIPGDSVYSAKFSDGAEWKLVPLGLDAKTNSMFFRVNLPPKTTYIFSPAHIATIDLQLGQTVIGIGGEANNATAVGRVLSLDMKNQTAGTTTVKYIGAIETDASFKNILDGSPFFNLSGDLVGLKLSTNNNGVFTPIATVSKELNLVNK